MSLLTDDEKSLLVLEHLGPKALAHDTMSLLEAFELGLKVAEAEVIKKLAAGVDVAPGVHGLHAFTETQLKTAIAAARVQENERCAKFLDASADRLEAVWKEHITSNKNANATSLHAIPRGYARDIRALLGATNG